MFQRNVPVEPLLHYILFVTVGTLVRFIITMCQGVPVQYHLVPVRLATVSARVHVACVYLRVLPEVELGSKVFLTHVTLVRLLTTVRL